MEKLLKHLFVQKKGRQSLLLSTPKIGFSNL